MEYILTKKKKPQVFQFQFILNIEIINYLILSFIINYYLQSMVLLMAD